MPDSEQELEDLKRELKEAGLRIKRLTRELELANNTIERNRVASAAKDNLNKIIEAKRSELEMYMNLLLKHCPDIILLFDAEGRIAYCTEVFLSMCGIPGFGMIRGMPFADLLTAYAGEDLAAQAAAARERLLSDNAGIVTLQETVDFGKTGRPRAYTIHLSPMLDEAGFPVGYMAFCYDTTDILAAQREAELANKAKSDFLATVSHEIRTPMNAIMGIANILKNTPLDPSQMEYLKSIQNSSNTLLNLINDILDFSKIEAGKLELLPEYFSLPGLLRHLKTMFELMFIQKSLFFICDFAPGLPSAVLSDEKRIGQILTNILNNAYKYTQAGGVTFRVYRGEKDTVVFEVEDTGIGIRGDTIPRLFTAFEQFDRARNKNVVGTGLGLAITRRLCEMMGGTIEVRSEYGKGSLFTVRLLLPEGTEADLPRANPGENAVFTTQGARVLLVDDIEINLEVAGYMLNSFGIEADLAQSGRAAIDLARKNSYDLILMDHMMPEMNGVEAAAAIRALGGDRAALPIVALTANAVSGAKEMFLANGFTDFLSKPVETGELARGLLKWLPPSRIVRKHENQFSTL